MTNAEIKAKIAGLEKALAASTDEGRKKAYQAGIDKLEAQLEPEKKQPEPKKETKAKPEKKKVVIKKKAEAKTEKPEPKFRVGEKVLFFSINSGKDEIGTVKEKKYFEKEAGITGEKGWLYHIPEFGDVMLSEKSIKEYKEQKSSAKELEIEKGSKKESHKLDTSFDKDIKDAVLTLNKHRFVVREIKNKTTKKVEQVHHSPEYRNAKTIQARVEKIFDSSIYDIAKTKKEKTEKKDIIEVVNEIKDLHTIWLNEVDMIINQEVKADLEAIKKLMLGLIKEAKKNDPDDKWLKYGGLSEIAKKYNL